MKNKLLALLPFLMFSSACSNNNWYANAFYVTSIGEGSSSNKYYCYDNNQSIVTKAFNTDTFIRIYQKNTRFDMTNKTLINDLFQDLHVLFDSNYTYTKNNVTINNIKIINDNYGNGTFIKIDKHLFQILKTGVELTKLSKGVFNIAIGSVTDLWTDYIKKGQQQPSFLYSSPLNEELETALSAVPSYEIIDEIIEFNDNESSIRINELKGAKTKVKINLGAIGKGYATKESLKLFKEKIGYISSGESSVSMISSSPFGYWRILVSNPIYKELNKCGNQDYINYNPYEIEIKKDGLYSFSTSGYYENFYYDSNTNKINSHIINGLTGISSNEYASVCALSEDPLLADAITTTLMNMTMDEGKIFIKRIKDTYKINIHPLWMKNIDGKLMIYADKYYNGALSINLSECDKNIISQINYVEI